MLSKDKGKFRRIFVGSGLKSPQEHLDPWHTTRRSRHIVLSDSDDSEVDDEDIQRILKMQQKKKSMLD